MKKLLKTNSTLFFSSLILCLLLVTLIAIFKENSSLTHFFKPLFIPILILALYAKRHTIKTVFVLFLLFSFLGDFLSVLNTNSGAFQYSGLFYFFSYVCLAWYVLSKLVMVKFDKVIGVYLILVLLVNSYFLYELFSLLRDSLANASQVSLFIFKNVSLTVLTFVSFIVYLNKDTKPSIIFFLMALCFVFSDVLHYITTYYVYSHVFAALDRFLHIGGLLLLYLYMVTNKKLHRNEIKTEKSIHVIREEQYTLNNY